MATAWESKFRWEAWADFLGHRDPEGLASFNKCGLAFIDVDFMPRRRMTDLFDRGGVPYEEWSPEELSRRFPGIDPGKYFPPKPLHADEFFGDPQGQVGAVYTPDAGFVDGPQRAAANLAAAAQHGGAAFRFKKQVVALRRIGDSWRLDLLGGQSLSAPLVVNAGAPGRLLSTAWPAWARSSRSPYGRCGRRCTTSPPPSRC